MPVIGRWASTTAAEIIELPPRTADTHHPKADVVVTVVGIVVVAVRRARVVLIVVPGSATQHPTDLPGSPTSPRPASTVSDRWTRHRKSVATSRVRRST